MKKHALLLILIILLVLFCAVGSVALYFSQSSVTLFTSEIIVPAPIESITQQTIELPRTEIVEQTDDIPVPIITITPLPLGLPVTFSPQLHKIFSDGLDVTLTEITDSRCKPEVQCIWAGELAATFTVTGGNFGKSVFILTLSSSQAPTQVMQGYTFLLTNSTADTATVLIRAAQPQTAPVTVVLPVTSKPLRTAPDLKPILTAPASARVVPDDAFLQEIARLIHLKTNSFRSKNSLQPLSTDTTLAKNARNYSYTLLTNNYLSHIDKNGCDLSCRFKNDNYSARAWGENLAQITYEERPTAEFIAEFFMTAWEKSAGHRKNLLSSTFTYQGIGISRDDTHVYAVVHFAVPL